MWETTKINNDIGNDIATERIRPPSSLSGKVNFYFKLKVSESAKGVEQVTVFVRLCQMDNCCCWASP